MEGRLIEFLLPLLNHWGYLLLFLLTFLETSAFLGLLVPGESIVVIAGLLASRGALDLEHVIGVASLGAILGDTVGYWIGHRFGEGFFLKYGKYFFFRKESLDEAKRFFSRHGGKVVFLGRFVGWLRAFAPVVAGLSRMPYLRFSLFNVLGGVGWAALFSLLGYLVGNSWGVMKGYLGRIGTIAFILSAITLYLYSLFKTESRRLREKIGWMDRKLSSQMPKTWSFVKDRFHVGEWYGLNMTAALIVIFLALLSFIEIADAVIEQETLFYIDFRVQKFMEGLITPPMTRFMVDVTNFASAYAIVITILLISIYLLYKRNGWDLFTLFLEVGMGEALLWLLKLFFHRARPVPQLITARGYSFPSGHAFAAIIVYGFLIYLAWGRIKVRPFKWAVSSGLVFLIVFIGISRIYLNAHWFTDVLGGYAAGFAWLVLSIMMVKILKEVTNKTDERGS